MIVWLQEQQKLVDEFSIKYMELEYTFVVEYINRSV